MKGELKRLLILLIAAVLCSILASCNSDSGTESENGGNTYFELLYSYVQGEPPGDTAYLLRIETETGTSSEGKYPQVSTVSASRLYE
jgi:hypothetical protein